MTCVIGYLDHESHKGYLAVDRMASSSTRKYLTETSKGFFAPSNHGVIIGMCGSFRNMNIMQYDSQLFRADSSGEMPNVTHEYMCRVAIPRMIDTTLNGVVDRESTDRAQPMLVVTNETIFIVQTDFSVLEPMQHYFSIGIGDAAALGAFYVLEHVAPRAKMTVERKLQIAMDAVVSAVPGVSREFVLFCTDGTKKVVSAIPSEVV